ncbi:MAG: extracellular solute-binding protein [Kiritimatiellae bacterium]|nr:extracellular solute-binding protein [Kiritimatiellia bacterium]
MAFHGAEAAVCATVLLLSCMAHPLATHAAEPVDVTFHMVLNTRHPEEPATKKLLQFSAAHPEIRPLEWGSLTLPGGGGRTAFMLALAGGAAPDVYKAWFHILRHDIEEGFCHPLDEWMCDWRDFPDVPQLWRDVATKDGHIYAVPTAGIAYCGLLYRKDIVRNAGLDPEKPPRTWREFEEWCRLLTDANKIFGGAAVQRGQRALAIENRPWGFLPWVQSAGGDVVGKDESGQWRSHFDSPAALEAAGFLQRLIAQGFVRALPTLSSSAEAAELFAQGEAVCVFGGENTVAHLTEQLQFPPEEIGIMPFPSKDGSLPRVLQAHKHFYAMTEGVARRPENERNAVWECVKALASQDVHDETVRKNVAEGRARWCDPRDLVRLGLEEYLPDIPPSVREMYNDLESGSVIAVTEPYMGFWQAASDLVSRRFLGLLLSEDGARFDYASALHSITEDANRGLMFDADKSKINEARPLARVVLGVVLIVALAAMFAFARHNGEKENPSGAKPLSPRGSTRISWTGVVPFLFLFPAVALIAVWSYYPLLRGAVMAFQDYRVVGGGEWVGLDNFIRVATDANFWKAWGRTFEYVGITLALGFLAPVALALLLSEIPRGKVFFRLVYFLPHLTSALVVTLLWKLMFDPTENGMLNQILAIFGVARHGWLQDPAWAMLCCILPGVWAGMGYSALIYIAALHSMPPDYYEAAALDGAGIFARFRHIALPQLAPLLVINFVGAFIAAFQGMGSIFLLTFGGPGDATSVLSLAIWKEAYNNLRFSTATTMAWFLGTGLIAFTILQIRILRRVEYRQAAAN